jgi:hypothetical protein
MAIGALHSLFYFCCLLFLCIRGTAAPINDNFAGRTILSGEHIAVHGTVSGATIEAGDPDVSVWDSSWKGTKQTIWWSWTAPNRGTLSVDSSASVLRDKAIMSLQGATRESLTNLTAARYDDVLLFNVQAGETYHIAVLTDSIQTGDVLLFLDFTPSPPHDDFSDRAHLAGKQFTFSGIFSGATDDFGSPEGHDLWCDWTAPETGRLRLFPLETGVYVGLYRGDRLLELQSFNTGATRFEVEKGARIVFRVCCGTNRQERPLFKGELDSTKIVLDPLVSIYPNPAHFRFVPDLSYPAPTNVVVGNTNLVGSPWEAILEPPRGQLGVTAYYPGGRIEEFSITGQVLLANDNFAQAALIGENGGTITVERLSLATREIGEPIHSTELGASGRSVWWRWRASRFQYLRVHAQYLNGKYAIYKGDTLERLTRVEPIGSFYGIYPMEEGTEYRFVVEGLGDNDRQTIRLEFLQPEANDSFSNRTSLPAQGTVTGRMAAATIEPGEPAAPGSLWYEWTAPAPGEVRFDTINPEDVLDYVGSPAIALISCFTGSSLSDLAAVSSTLGPNIEKSEFRANVQRGERLLVRITGSDFAALSTGSGVFILKASFDKAPANDFFANRETIQSLPYSASFNSKWTSFEPGEEHAKPGRLLQTAWWEWTAPDREPVSFSAVSGDTGRGAFKTRAVVQIFKGDSFESLAAVPGETNSMGDFVLNPVPGENYKIAVFADYNVVIRFQASTRAANDNFTNATLLPAKGSSWIAPEEASFPIDWGYWIPFSYLGATFEPEDDPTVLFFGVPTPTTGNLWWKFIAPADGLLKSVSASAYFGTNRNELQLMSNSISGGISSEGSSFSWLPVSAGQTYYFEARDLLVPNQPPPIGEKLTYNFGTFRIAGITNGAVYRQGTDPVISVFPPDADYDGEAVGGLALRLFALDTWNSLPTTIRMTNLPSTITFTNLAPGNYLTYAIGVNNRGEIIQTQTANFDVRETNDVFSDRELFDQLAAGSLAGTSFEPGESELMPANTTGSLWFEWIAPGNEKVRFYVDTISEGTLAVFTGSSINTLQAIAPPAAEVVFPAIAGVSYKIALLKTTTNRLSHVSLYAQRPPTNDYFLNATVIPAWTQDISIGTSTRLTSIEPGEPAIDGLIGSAWWRWTADSSGVLKVNGDTNEWSVFAGTNISQLKRAEMVNSSTAVSAGTTYYFRQGRHSETAFDGGMQFHFEARRNNDDFDGALPLETPARMRLEGLPGTLQDSEPSNGEGKLIGSFWWKWTPSLTGPVNGAISPFWFLELFKGNDLSSLQTVEPDHIGYNQGQRLTSWNVTAGQAYFVRASYSSPFAFSQAEFVLSQPAIWPIQNDDFVNRITLSGDKFKIQGDTSGSTLEPGEGEFAGSLWWSWKASRSGTVRIWWPADTYLRLYRGAGILNLSMIIDWPTAFSVTAGEEIYIAVYRWAGGPFEWNLDLSDEPSNGSIDAADFIEPDKPVIANFSGLPGRLNRDGSLSTAQSLYWKWTAPQGGRTSISGDSGLNSYFILPAFALGQVDAVAGRTYLIEAAGSKTGNVELNFEPTVWTIKSEQSTDRLLRVDINGPASGVLDMDQSTDLLNWVPFQTIRLSGNPISLAILISNLETARFFRAISIR